MLYIKHSHRRKGTSTKSLSFLVNAKKQHTYIIIIVYVLTETRLLQFLGNRSSMHRDSCLKRLLSDSLESVPE